MTQVRPYVGRFAPSPTGRLHLGSMVAAVASYLDARARGGTWFVRMEDLDPPREVPGAADGILRTLEGFGLNWDGEVLYQHTRHEAYRAALDMLVEEDKAFGCCCTRRDLAEADGLQVYPGTCRAGLPSGVEPRSWRFRMPDHEELVWQDAVQGDQRYASGRVGDVTLLRADGQWAYHLAVVVDDEYQEITDVVRGADLVDATAAHIALQRALGFRPLRYAHLPIVTNAQGQKLSKQSLAQPVSVVEAPQTLKKVFDHLRITGCEVDAPPKMLDQATSNWQLSLLKQRGA